jgi:hypothetical protein
MSVHIQQKQIIFNIFGLCLVESSDVEPVLPWPWVNMKCSPLVLVLKS